MRAYVYLVPTSQVQVRSVIVGNAALVVDAQKVFWSTFKELINEDYPIGIDIKRYQGVIEHALSKVDFSVGTGIYMLPSNLNLNIGKAKGYNNEILVSNTDMKIGSNREILLESIMMKKQPWQFWLWKLGGLLIILGENK